MVFQLSCNYCIIWFLKGVEKFLLNDYLLLLNDDLIEITIFH